MARQRNSIVASRLVVEGTPLVDCVVQVVWQPVDGWIELGLVAGSLRGVAPMSVRSHDRDVEVEGWVESMDCWFDVRFLGSSDGDQRLWCGRGMARFVQSDPATGRLREAVRAVREGRAP